MQLYRARQIDTKVHMEKINLQNSQENTEKEKPQWRSKPYQTLKYYEASITKTVWRWGISKQRSRVEEKVQLYMQLYLEILYTIKVTS